jgi:hypothetical protein
MHHWLLKPSANSKMICGMPYRFAQSKFTLYKYLKLADGSNPQTFVPHGAAEIGLFQSAALFVVSFLRKACSESRGFE